MWPIKGVFCEFKIQFTPVTAVISGVCFSPLYHTKTRQYLLVDNEALIEIP